MPVTVFRYGRVSTYKQAISPEAQAAMTLREFEHQKAIGILPEDSIDHGFYGDLDTSRSIPFLQRKMGFYIQQHAKKGDRVIVAAYDRLIGSPKDCVETLQWSLDKQIHLVIMDLRIDTSTNHGRMICQIIAAVKENERLEIGRRTKETLSHLKAQGYAVGAAPIGFQRKNIIPAGGGRTVKWWFPWAKERQFAKMIAMLHDESGLSFRKIAVKFWKEKVIKPRTGKPAETYNDLHEYYWAYKHDFPLDRKGRLWQPPSFKFKVVQPVHTIDLNRASA